MAAKGMLTAKVRQNWVRLRPSLVYIFAALLLSFAVSTRIAAYGHNSTKNLSFQQQHDNFFSAEALEYQLPEFTLPSESPFIPTDREVPGENESEDDFECDWDLTTHEDSPYSAISVITKDNWLPYSASSLHSRNSIPLFILYHSWKSFVA